MPKLISPEWLRDEAKEIFLKYRKLYPNANEDNLAILADGLSNYQKLSKVIDITNPEACNILQKFFNQYKNMLAVIEKTNKQEQNGVKEANKKPKINV